MEGNQERNQRIWLTRYLVIGNLQPSHDAGRRLGQARYGRFRIQPSWQRQSQTEASLIWEVPATTWATIPGEPKEENPSSPLPRLREGGGVLVLDRYATVPSVSGAASFAGDLPGQPAAVAIDAPLTWPTGPKSLRRVDEELRQRYPEHKGRVMATNSLRGSVAVQGPSLALALARASRTLSSPRRTQS